ncbi:MAG: DUF3574 domain-containing protein [Gemmatirosa sp.]|nr:DUF3574 domain-containing protein [Gemmatirosa sp.]
MQLPQPTSDGQRLIGRDAARGADGTIVREPSHLLILDHPDDAASEQAVRKIIAACKTQFQQEAVFRARSRACISF